VVRQIFKEGGDGWFFEIRKKSRKKQEKGGKKSVWIFNLLSYYGCFVAAY